MGIESANGYQESIIDKEIKTLSQIKELGLPTVNPQKIYVDGQPAIIMDKFVQGSKDIVRTIDGKVKIIGDASLLNDRSVADLEKILYIMKQKSIRIRDLQFLIGKNGKVVIADPLGVVHMKPSPVNIKTINKLINAAKHN